MKDAARRTIWRAGGREPQALGIGRLETLDLGDLIRDARGLLRRILGPDIALELALNPKPAWVEGNRAELRQMLVDLAFHASHALREGGVLALATKRTCLDPEQGRRAGLPVGSYHEVKVHERRPDGAERSRQRSWDPGPEAMSRTYEVVERHRGRLRLLQTLPGQPASIWLLLPESRNRAVEGQETILVVEDEPALRQVAGRILRDRGYRVIEAADGRQALNRLESEGLRPDLVLTDVVMPELSGPEMAQHVRARLPQVEFVYVTAYSDTVLMSLGPPGALLSKPFTPAELAGKVREQLDSRQPPATA